MRAAPLPTTSVSLRLPIGSGGNRFQQLHHRLIGPVIRMLVDLGVAARADRRIDLLALAEAVPELLHLVGCHVVGAALGRWLGHRANEMIQNARAKPNGRRNAKRAIDCMRRRSVTSNSGLRLYFFARSATCLLIIMYSNIKRAMPTARPTTRPCRADSMRLTVA